MVRLSPQLFRLSAILIILVLIFPMFALPITNFALSESGRGDETWFFGHVKDKDTEDPIIEAEITIRKGNDTYTTYTNEEGYYDQQVEGGGEYTLIAEHSDYRTEDARAVVETGDEKRVDFLLEKKEQPQTWFFGHVKDSETEEPIVEAEVIIRKGDHTVITYTDAEGYYDKQVEEGGEYTLWAEKEGYHTQEKHEAIETGDEKRVDFLLEEKEESQTWFFGHVKDNETEEPIVEAEVIIRKGDHTVTTYTDAEGYYDQQVEGGGEYTLWAEKEGYHTQEKHEAVETGDEKRVDFLLVPKEEAETWFFGHVKDKDTEEPILEAEVTIRKGDHSYTTYTDAEGYYDQQVEGGGEYTLIAEHMDYKTEDARAVVETGDEKRVDFLLEKKEQEETWVVGRVRDKETEEPIVEAEITIRKGEHEFTTFTNEEGHYSRQFDIGGEITIIVEKEGYQTEDAHVVVETGEEKRVEFLLEKEEEDPETWLFGHVKDKETEDPISGAEVTIRKGDHSYTASTDSEGYYARQVEGGGEYTLIAEHEDYKIEDARAVVETGEEKRVDFLLEEKESPRSWFFGTVTDNETGDPIVEAEITITKGDVSYTTLTNSEGSYEVEVEGGGQYTLIAEHEDYETGEAHAEVETGDEERVDFSLDPEGGRGSLDFEADADEPDTIFLQLLVVLFVGLLGALIVVIYLPSRYFKK